MRIMLYQMHQINQWKFESNAYKQDLIGITDITVHNFVSFRNVLLLEILMNRWSEHVIIQRLLTIKMYGFQLVLIKYLYFS